MNLRLEVGRSQRTPFAWFLRAARRHPSFRLERADGVDVGILEFEDWVTFIPYYYPVRLRSKVYIYRDDILVSDQAVMEATFLARGLTKFGTLPSIEDPNHLTPRTSEMMRGVLGRPWSAAPTVCPNCGEDLTQ